MGRLSNPRMMKEYGELVHNWKGESSAGRNFCPSDSLSTTKYTDCPGTEPRSWRGLSTSVQWYHGQRVTLLTNMDSA